MAYSREAMISHLENFQKTVKLHTCYFGERTPLPSYWYQLMTHQRLIIPLRGITPMLFAMNGKEVRIDMQPGEALFFGPYCWSTPRWVPGQEVLSIVLFNNRLLRVIYLKSNIKEDVRSKHDPDDYYHVEDTLSNCTIFILRALESFRPALQSSRAAIDLANCLVETTLTDLKQSMEERLGKGLQTWHSITQYMEDNFTRNITRESVAKRFHVTSNHVSHMFKRFANMTFCAYLNRLRLSHAAYLLKSTDITLDEIAWETGYHSTSYFLRLFKETYQVSPTIFRRDYSHSVAPHPLEENNKG